MYKVLDETCNELQMVELTSTDYEGIIITYGKVELIDEGDHARLKFDYDIIDDNDKQVDPDTFKTHLGDILVELIEKGAMNNTLTYTGGVE